MPIFANAATDVSWIFIELGAAVIGLSLLAGVANRAGISTVPFYLLGGLAFGNGGLIPLRFSEDVVHLGAEIGVVLLLFMLGLESTGDELANGLRSGFLSGIVDMILNATPGVLAAIFLGWGPRTAMLLGGVTWISSSGMIARLLNELGWRKNPETPAVLSVLVLEDLAMAVFLPLAAVVLAGSDWVAGLGSVLAALAAVLAILALSMKFGRPMSQALAGATDEGIVLFTFGLVLLVAGLAQRLQVSAAVGAFLVGVALSGPVVDRVHRLIGPLRDLFAALFFLFFGLEIDPSTLVPVLLPAAALAAVSVVTKLVTGWYSTRRAGVGVRGRRRAGLLLVARGEFSIVIAGLGVSAGVEPALGPLSAAYVLILAILGTVLARGFSARLGDPSPLAPMQEA
jgi:CPA2 family monovalent cation:H+ antiporter-2